MTEYSPLELVIFDWAGTIVDHGSMAPIRALTELFRRHGIALEAAEARRDMGLAKRDHIASIAAGRGLRGDAAVTALYEEFLPLQTGLLDAHAALLPGVAAMAKRLQELGLKLATCTGYTRPMLDQLLTLAARQGFRPDANACPSDAGSGRPGPSMCMKLAMDVRLADVARAVKIGDTEADIAEGRHAGMWTIGVTETGNEVGLPPEIWTGLSALERAQRRTAAEDRLRAAGAHYVIPSAAQCEPVLRQIASRLRSRERP